jgi:hypothetical protein
MQAFAQKGWRFLIKGAKLMGKPPVSLQGMRHNAIMMDNLYP